MKVNALVISYNSTIKQSHTLQSLLMADSENINLTIYIWNNGPHFFEENDVQEYINACKKNGTDIYIFQDVRNVSLAKIYNYIINKNNFEFIAILDQDSTVNIDYLQNIIKYRSSDLILPRIVTFQNNSYVQSHPHSSKNKNIIINDGPITSNISSVTSGIIISKHLVEKLVQFRGYVFEERLGFYGIDVDFFITVNAMIDRGIAINVFCIGFIKHSFASNDEVEFKSPFRYLELLYFKIFFRNNHQKKNKITTLWIWFREIIRGKLPFRNALLALLFTFKNKHPRSKFDIESNVKATHSSHSK